VQGGDRPSLDEEDKLEAIRYNLKRSFHEKKYIFNLK
jgi:hypothetical protein